MYPVSEEYLETITSNNLMATWYGTITTKSGIVYEITAENMNLSSTRFIHEIVSGSSLEIGSAYSKELQLDVYVEYDEDRHEYVLNGTTISRYDFYDAEIHLIFRLYLDLEQTEYEDVPCGGTFYVAVPEITSDTLKMTAYDAMERFKAEVSNQSVGTAYDYLTWMCEECEVELGVTQAQIEALPNGTLPVYFYTGIGSGSTYLEALNGIAALLNCYAVLGTDDKLYLRQYGMTPTRSISDDWRYAIQISDYETHYSSITLTDAVNDAVVEAAVSGDEGLDYDLGENPFLQYGLQETKQEAIQNIIDDLNSVTYTPFEATIPIDPSLEVGDVVEFTEGRAVSGKYAAIMGIEYSLDGSCTIRCVGDNPRLVESESDTDRDLQSILNKIDAKTIYYYDYVNVQSITIGAGEQTAIISINYVTSESSHIDFHAEVKHDLTVTDSTVSPYAKLKVTYYIDDEEVEDYYPIEEEFEGTHLLHLLYTFMSKENTRGKFVALLEVENGSIFIDVNNSRAYIAGQGLVTSGAEWDGTIEVTDNIGYIDVAVGLLEITDAPVVSLEVPMPVTASEVMALQRVAVTTLPITEIYNVNPLIMIFSPWTNQDLVTTTASVTSGVGWVGTGSVSSGTSAVVTTEEIKGTERIVVDGTGNLYSNQTKFVMSPDSGTTWYGYDYVNQQWVQDYQMYLFEVQNIPAAEWAKLDSVIIRAYVGGTDTVYAINAYGADDDVDVLNWYILSTTMGNSTYNHNYVSAADSFELITDYEYESAAGTIDSGYMRYVDIDTTNFSSVESINVIWGGITY